MAHVVDPMKMSRELFVDDESYATYQQQLKLMEHAAKGLVDEFADVEAEKDDLTTCVGKMENEKLSYKNKCEAYEALLGLRNRIERLEKILYSSDLTPVSNRILKWKLILETGAKNPIVKQLRDRILKNHLSIDVFVSNLSDLYETYSNTRIHRIKGKIYTEDEIKRMIEENEGNLDEIELLIIQILFQKLDMSQGDMETNEGFDSSFKYLRISRVPSDKDMEAKIRTYFRSKKSIKDVSKEKDGVYLVEFTDINEAISAYLNHEAAIENRNVHLQITNKTVDI